MAPKRSDDSKGKAAAQAGTSAAAARGASLTAAMPVTRAGGEAIAKVRHLVAASSNEHGVTELRPSGSILILAIFAYFCEAYVGIRPSVALFRSFYSLRNTARGERLGCVSFRIAAARSEECRKYAQEAIIEMMIFRCIHDL